MTGHARLLWSWVAGSRRSGRRARSGAGVMAKSGDYTIQIQVNAIMPSDRDKVHKPLLELSPAKWLWWFLKNHDNAPLISAGLWKRSGLVVESVGDRADAVQAAYSVAGKDGAWSVVLDALRGVDVA